MLSSYDRRRFNEIASGLLAEDPGLGTRLTPPRVRPARPGLAVLLWLSMPFAVVLGGGTGLLVAIALGGYGAHFWFRGGGSSTGGIDRNP